MRARPVPTLSGTDRARFLAKIAGPDENGCRLWTAGVTGDGYGRFRLGGRDVYVHRIAYTLFVGLIPDGFLIDHRCFNHACCTPEHLRPTTQKQNQENRVGAAGNSQSGVRGVSPRTTKAGKRRWRATVGHNRKVHELGHFDTVEEAEAAVVAGRIVLFTHNDLDRTGATA